MKIKEINGAKGYFVTEEGTVFRILKSGKESQLKGHKTSNGEKTYTVVVGKKYTRKRCHFLVAEAFIDNPLKFKMVIHINGDKSDNRVCNLMWGTLSASNHHHIKPTSKTKSGVVGVYWNRQKLKWEAKLCVDYKLMSLGTFYRFEDACEARRRAEEAYVKPVFDYLKSIKKEVN